MTNKCSICQYWKRQQILDWPNKPIQSNIGKCSMLENNVNYFDYMEILQEKIQDGKIGADNLHTHENFGCIHHKSNQ